MVIKLESKWECISRMQCCGNLSPEAHYPWMTRVEEEGSDSEARVVFSVMGMTCAACAGSVEKAIKRLPGIREALVDVLNDKALVLYYPQIVIVSFYLLIIIHSFP